MPVPGRRERGGGRELHACAVATSGSYRHVADWDGLTVSHTMDPRSGVPARADIASVSVLAPDCMAADAWATALMVAGAERGSECATRHGLSYVMVLTDGSVHTSL